MDYSGPERRKYSRITGRFIVSYRMIDERDASIDVTQSKNISLVGMLLTTNRSFKPGSRLALEIRLPFDPHPIMMVAKVVESREITRDLIYDTRLEFIAVDDKHRKVIMETVNYYIKRG